MRSARTPRVPPRLPLGAVLWALAMALPAGRAEGGEPAGPTIPAEAAGTRTPDDGRGTPYVVEKSDNICGLDEPKQLSQPAVVDYQKLLDATPQFKQMKRDKVDPNSARGIQLRTEAEALVREKCQAVQDSKGHCSVWKKIERRDGGKIPDVTEAVKKKISGA